MIHARTAYRYLISVCQHLHVRILSKLSPDGFFLRGGKIEYVALLLHNLEDAYFRQIAFARGEGNLIVVAQEIKYFLHYSRLPVKRFLKDVTVVHGAVGLSEGVGLVLDAEHCQVL